MNSSESTKPTAKKAAKKFAPPSPGTDVRLEALLAAAFTGNPPAEKRRAKPRPKKSKTAGEPSGKKTEPAGA